MASHFDSSVLGEADPFKGRDKLVHSNSADAAEAFKPRHNLLHSNDANETFASRDKLIHSNSDIDPERLKVAISSHPKPSASEQLSVETTQLEFRSDAPTQPLSPISPSSQQELSTAELSPRSQQLMQEKASALGDMLSKVGSTVTHAVTAIGIAVEEEAVRLKAQYHAYRAQDTTKELGDRVSLSTQSHEEMKLAQELSQRKHQEFAAAGLGSAPEGVRSNAP